MFLVNQSNDIIRDHYLPVPEIFEMAGILSLANLSVNYFEITSTQ